MSGLPNELAAARLKLAKQRPYLSTALWSLQPRPIDAAAAGMPGAIGVDAQFRLYYDQNGLNGWTVDELSAVLYHECFPAGTHVLTMHGYRPIETVRVGDAVLTHEGRWRAVTSMGQREAETLKMSAQGVELEGTADHPILTATTARRRAGHRRYVEARGWTSLGDLTREHYYAVPIEVQTTVKIPAMERTHWREAEIPDTTAPAFWKFVGLWLGDGSLMTAPYRQRPQYRRSIIEIATHTKDADTTRGIVKAAVPSAKVAYRQTDRKCGLVTIGHKPLADWLWQHFGRGAREKRLPGWVHGLPKECLHALLDGYLAADGYQTKAGRWQASTVSHALALGLRMLGVQLGHSVNVYKRKSGTATFPNGRVYATSEGWALRFMPRSRYSNTIVYEGKEWYRVKQLSPGRRTLVYNLEVDEDHSYVVENVIVHNCGHLLRDHAGRGESMHIGREEQVRWNVACFPAGTLLPNGVRIEQTATMRRSYEGDLVRVVTQAGNVEATPEHPFYVRRRLQKPGAHPVRLGAAAWVEAGEIREGDFVCVPKVPRTEMRAESEIDLRSYIRAGTDGKGRRTFGNHAVKAVPLTPDVAWLIGLYVAEGSASPTVRFSLGAHERETHGARAAAIMSSLGYTGRIYAARTSAIAVSCGSVVLGRWLKEHCGTHAAVKHAPRMILYHADAAIRRAFVQGVVDGDGCTYRGRVHVGTVSEALAHDLVVLLAQDNLGATIQLSVRPPRQIGAGWTETTERLYDVSWMPHGASVSTRVMNGRAVRTRHGRWKSDADGVWVPVKALTRRPYAGLVFNMTTPSHTYVANGLLVHNCDMEINDDIAAEGAPLPKGACLPKHIRAKDGQLAETYYHLLESKMQKPPCDCGSASGGGQRPWEEPSQGSGKDGNGVSPGQAELVRQKVAQDVREHSRSRGDTPGWLQRWADDRLDSRVDWRRLLAAYIRRACGDATGLVDFTYSRLSRRSGPSPQIVLPALRQPTPRVAVVVDTSGSMGQDDLAVALAEIDGILKAAGQRTGVSVLSCDAAVHTTQRVMRRDAVRLEGGGGTDMRVGIRAALEQRPRPHAVILISDGETPYPEQEPSVPLIVVLTRAGSQGQAPSWARVVVVDESGAAR